MEQDNKPPGQGAGGRRRGRGFQRAGQPLRKGIAAAAARRGFAEPDVLLRWAEIVGPALAPGCRPVRVSYGREPGLGATLVVQAEGARATEIEHLGPMILERVNRYYGYRAVSRLRLTQAGDPPPGFAEPAAGFAGPGVSPVQGSRPAPSPAALAEAEELARDIRDPGLRAALARLGARVLATAGTTQISRQGTSQGDHDDES